MTNGYPRRNPYQAYQRISVSTADPVRVVIMLYEGAIKNLHQAIEHFRTSNNDRASERINKTLDIIHYLRSSLDHDQGGEIAANLEGVYDFVRDNLALANIQTDVELINEAIGVLQTLLEGWRGIVLSDVAKPDSPPDKSPDSPPNKSPDSPPDNPAIPQPGTSIPVRAKPGRYGSFANGTGNFIAEI